MATGDAVCELEGDVVVACPKVVLHDHLDGGVRPETYAELAGEQGRHVESARWADEIARRADAGSLVGYLETFTEVTSVLQSGEALERVAAEAVCDLASDGVVYAELRFAPELHTRGGLDLSDAIDAVCSGLALGEARVERGGGSVTTRAIVCAIRTGEQSLAAAQAAAADRSGRVAGFDIAGDEMAGPALEHRAAYQVAHDAGLGLTAHAGESVGNSSVRAALELGVTRLGHGISVVEDIRFDERRGVWCLGPVATRVLEDQVCLEVCVSSNLHTGAVRTLREHPVGLLFDLGFRVSLSCDNRTMSATSTSRELAMCAEAFGWEADDAWRVARNSLDAAFCGPGTAAAIWRDQFEPWVARVDAGAQRIDTGGRRAGQGR